MKILLTSLPRSGSTWVQKALAQAPGAVGVFEPDHLGDLGLGVNGMHPYLDNDACGEYLKIFERAFTGKTSEQLALTRKYYRGFIKNVKFTISPPKCVIVKSVYSVSNTELLYERFMPKVLVLLRNPYSVAHSIHRKWPNARLQTLLDQPGLVEAYLSPYVSLIERAKTPLEILATRIGAYHLISISAAQRNPSWHVVTHEQLCEDPIDQFRSLYHKLGLEWTSEAAAWLSNTNKPKEDDSVLHVNRVSSMEIDKWRRLLSPGEINQIREFYEPFNIEFYKGLG